jgi:GMP synthase (glutamine-hydrolysing)
MPRDNRFVLYLDIEHPQALLDRRERARHMRGIRRNAGILREASDCGCLIQSFIWFDENQLQDLPLLAMVIGGNRTDWVRYTPGMLRETCRALTETDVPVLGICGGHQLLAKAFGGRVAPMGRLGPGEDDPWEEYHPGYLKERGFTKVAVNVAHPLFDGLGPEIVVSESHYCEVKRLPATFEALASSQACGVQAMAHVDGRVLGVQFHPERYDARHPDGLRLLRNFFAIARGA